MYQNIQENVNPYHTSKVFSSNPNFQKYSSYELVVGVQFRIVTLGSDQNSDWRQNTPNRIKKLVFLESSPSIPSCKNLKYYPH